MQVWRREKAGEKAISATSFCRNGGLLVLQETHRSMGRFRAKPIVVEAFQWHGGMFKKSFPPWFTKLLKTGEAKIYKKLGNPYIRINSAFALHTAATG